MANTCAAMFAFDCSVHRLDSLKTVAYHQHGITYDMSALMHQQPFVRTTSAVLPVQAHVQHPDLHLPYSSK